MFCTLISHRRLLLRVPWLLRKVIAGQACGCYSLKVDMQENETSHHQRIVCCQLIAI